MVLVTHAKAQFSKFLVQTLGSICFHSPVTVSLGGSWLPGWV